LGVTYDSLEQYTQAIDFYQQSSEIARDIGDYRGEANSLFNKGQSLARCQPRRLEALATLQQVRTIYTELRFDYMVEKCDKAIHDFNRSIATKSRDRRIKICLWFCVGVAIVLLIAWLRK
ncbi:MAG: tetratricopeptide repeat protein, partial [Phormidesmis sp. CAN_BIN36]|nr:tetratricopeptide repeat protein [Phormidesmis sp. CAN_BIN36]